MNAKEKARQSRLKNALFFGEAPESAVVVGNEIVVPGGTQHRRHTFKMYARTGCVGKELLVSAVAIERCTCGAERRRWTTTKERAQYREDERQMRMMHRAWHAFSKALGKQKGYDAMLLAEKFSKGRFAQDVQVVGVDDSYHSSSCLVLTDHVNDRQYWGTSVTFIPQCSGEDPINFFLYPAHRRALMEALQKIDARERKFKKTLRSPR